MHRSSSSPTITKFIDQTQFGCAGNASRSGAHTTAACFDAHCAFQGAGCKSPTVTVGPPNITTSTWVSPSHFAPLHGAIIAIGIGGNLSDCTAATPPGMRVRIGRFEKLRS
jgi:hypothetical protein